MTSSGGPETAFRTAGLLNQHLSPLAGLELFGRLALLEGARLL